MPSRRSDPSLEQESPRKARLAIFASHPIQYHLPWFRELSASSAIELKVFFTLLPDAEQQGDGFDVSFTWDLPLLDGYQWERLPAATEQPRLGSFFGNRLSRPARRIADWRPDVAVLTGWQNIGLVQSLLACKRLGLPCIIRAEANSLKRRKWAARIAHRFLVPRFDAFLSIGRANRDFYRANRAQRERIFDCPYFVDNQRFITDSVALAQDRDGLRRRWEIRAEDICFLFAGKLTPKKRILDLIAAIDLARRQNPHIRLLVVGDGAQKAEARRAVEAEGLPVTFAGFLNQSEIAQAYVASDCLVLPSDYGETWGLVVNEAMACERPAIVSDRVGCRQDLVEEGSTGFAFPFGDAEALAAALIEAASDRDRLAEFGRTARARVLEGYSVEKAVQGTLEAVRFVSSAKP